MLFRILGRSWNRLNARIALLQVVASGRKKRRVNSVVLHEIAKLLKCQQKISTYQNFHLILLIDNQVPGNIYEQLLPIMIPNLCSFNLC